MSPKTEQNAPAPVRVAIYTRISRDLRDGEGVKRQEKDCRELADAREWEVVAVFSDNDTSAFRNVARPGYADMCEAIERGKVDVVVAWAPDRLHRRPIELNEYIELTERHGVTTRTVRAGHWDLSTPSGRVQARIMGDLAAYESEHRADRVRAALKADVMSGRPPTSGRRCFGYTADMTAIIEDEAKWLRHAAARLLAGASLREIVREMNTAGQTTTAGNPWRTTALRDTLKRPRLAGLSSLNETARKGKRSRDGVVVYGPGQWEPIIDETTWRAVVALLDNPARRANKRGTAPAHMGSGLYTCPCGHTLRFRTRPKADGSRVGFYFCHAKNDLDDRPAGGHVSRNAAQVDELVTEVILQRLENDDVLTLLAQQADGGNDDQVTKLTAELDALRSRAADFEDQAAAGVVSVDAFVRISGKIDARIADVERELANLAGDDADGVLAMLKGVTDFPLWWDTTATIEDKRRLVDTFVDVVVLPAPRGTRTPRPDLIRVTWKSGM